MSNMHVRGLRRLGLVLALSIGGYLGCATTADPAEPAASEVAQQLARCGEGGSCGAGWVCRAQDGACHPACTVVIVEQATPSPSATSSQRDTDDATVTSCTGIFSSWQCCSGGYCAVSCP
jgi:hypothetical protein